MRHNRRLWYIFIGNHVSFPAIIQRATLIKPAFTFTCCCLIFSANSRGPSINNSVRSYRAKPSNLPIHLQPDPLYLRHLVLIALCHMSNVVYLKHRRGFQGSRGGWVRGGGMGVMVAVVMVVLLGRVRPRNWRRHPPVTFYSLTLADYRQLMHNKYTPLRVHYHLINISPWGWGGMRPGGVRGGLSVWQT